MAILNLSASFILRELKRDVVCALLMQVFGADLMVGTVYYSLNKEKKPSTELVYANPLRYS
jgi:hypothetical protein